MPGAPLFRRTATHARHRTSLRQTLSYSAWNLRPGSALAARYSACCKARTGSAGIPRRSLRGGTSTDGTHRAPPRQHCAPTKQRPFPSPRLCCPPAQPVLRPPPTPTRPAIHFPGSPVIGRHAPATHIRRPPGRGGPPQFPPPPSIRSAPHTPGSPSRLRFQALHRFHGLHPDFGGSALPVPARTGGTSNDAAGFASCYGPHRRSPLQGF